MSQNNSINVVWGDTAKTYIRWSFYGDWDAETYFESLLQLWKMIDTKQAHETLKLVIDLRLSNKTPSNLTALMRAAIRQQDHDCDVNMVVVVSKGSFWSDMYQIASRHSVKMANLNVQFVSNDNEVNHYLSR